MRDQDCGAITGCAAPRCQGNACITVPVDGGVICRPSLGVCDVEERCSGVTTQCPVNVLRTTVCAPAAFPCEADAVCNGVDPFCPAKPFRDAGSVCASPACLPPVTCSGVATACLGPADAGPLCDDRNVCSVDTCAGGTSCTWAVEPSITSRALLNSFADGGVIRVVLPSSTSTFSFPLGDLTVSLCPAGPRFMTTPPECMLEVRTTGMTFTTTRTTQFSGAGPASMRVQLLPVSFSGLFSGAGGVSMGVESCAGAMPPSMVSPVNVPVTYAFRIDEPDGGLLTLQPFGNNEADIRNQVRACLPGSAVPMLATAVSDSVRNVVAGTIRQAVEQAFAASLMEQLCLRPSDAGVCQYGMPTNGLCRAGTNCFSGRHFRDVVPTIPACVR